VSIIDLSATVVGADGGEIVIELNGDVDLSSAALITSVVDSALAEGGPKITVDMSGVTFLDSRGIRALLMAQRTAERRGSVLVLRSPTKRTMDVLVMSGCATMLSIQPA